MKKVKGMMAIGSFILLLVLYANPAFGDVFGVKGDFLTIQDAINASVDGDLILVSPDTYVENINFLGKAVTIQSTAGPALTIIDGDQLGSAVTFASNETIDTVLDGFTIRNGVADDGGGVYCWGSSPTIMNCMIVENSVSKAWSSGGGICSNESAPTFINCVIADNSAEYGGAISLWTDSAVEFISCTIADNTATQFGGGIYTQHSSVTLTNCILWGDSAPDGPEITLLDSSDATVSYSNVQGGEAAAHVDPLCILDMSEGIIDADPLFVGGGDYHLTPISPCLDTGTAVTALTDIDGDVRPQMAWFDMGADELLAPPCFISLVW